jgi:hypothetical protein
MCLFDLTGSGTLADFLEQVNTFWISKQIIKIS